MAKQTFTTGQVLTAAQVNALNSNDFNQTVSVKTAAHTLVVGDRGTRVEFNTSGSVTCTVNSGIFDAGDTLVIQNRGAGAVTVTAGTATVNTEGSLVVNQYGSAILYFISASAAILFAGAAGDITAVNAGTGISGGGSSGSVTITNSMATEIDAKGDLIVGTGADTFARLAVGTNGHTLVADSSTATGLAYAAPAGGGKVLQVVQGTNSSSFSTTSTSFQDITGLNASITPSDSAHKVLVMYFINGATRTGDDDNGIIFDIVRGSSTTVTGELRDVAGTGNSIGTIGTTVGGSFLDSPSTTSSTTYKARIRCNNAGITAFAQVNNVTSTIILLEIDN